ncbi:MAG: chorismate mutase [Candidatus Hodarchaeota archaeon]
MLKENKVFDEELEKYRKKIDRIDDKIIKLLDERGKLAKNLGIFKKKHNVDIYQPEREEYVIERMSNKSKILKNISIESIWREIIKGCKIIQTMDIPEKKY